MNRPPEQEQKPEFSNHVLDLRQFAKQLQEEEEKSAPKASKTSRFFGRRKKEAFSLPEEQKEPEKVDIRFTGEATIDPQPAPPVAPAPEPPAPGPEPRTQQPVVPPQDTPMMAPDPQYDLPQQAPGMPGTPPAPPVAPQPSMPGEAPVPQAPPEPKAPGKAATSVDPDPYMDLTGMQQDQPYFGVEETANHEPIFPETPPKQKKTRNPKRAAKLFGKAIASFGFLAAIFLLPILLVMGAREAYTWKDTVLAAANDAITSLKTGGAAAQDMSMDTASEEFEAAHLSFVEAGETFERVDTVLGKVAPLVPKVGDQYETAVGLVEAGEELTHAATLFANAANVLQGESFEMEPGETTLTDVLAGLQDTLLDVQTDVNAANTALARVNLEAVPEDQREQVAYVLEQMPVLTQATKDTLGKVDLLLSVLGHDTSRRYLFLFQNNYEMRATGGFIGSIALMDIADGHVEDLTVPGGGVYDISGQLDEAYMAPAPLQLVSANWNLQDANWWPDFPTSARKIQWFFEKADQPSVDGVLALNPDVIERLLTITGPIAIDEYDQKLSAENFYEWAQEKAERKADETLESKDFLGMMAPALLNRLFEQEPEQMAETIAALMTALEEKDIILYFNDTTAEARVLEEGWGGAIAQVEHDYLHVVHTNISGGKTDQAIDTTIKHRADVQEDGSIIDTVTITKIHRGIPEQGFDGVMNTDYLRIYVPQGSELISSEGFATMPSELFEDPSEDAIVDADLLEVSGQILRDDVTGIATNEEFGKTVFGNWMTVEPGESTTVTISYKLPFHFYKQGNYTHTGSYGLFIQKQSGAKDPFFYTSITLPEKGQLVWAHPEFLRQTTNGFSYAADLKTDTFLGFLYYY